MSTSVQTQAWVGIAEDILDLIMTVGGLGYIFLLNDTNFALSKETMAAIGTTAGGTRLLLRRIVRRIVEVRVGKEPVA